MKGFLVCLMIGLIGNQVDAATTSYPIGETSQSLDELSTRAPTTTTTTTTTTAAATSASTTVVSKTSESQSQTTASQAQQTNVSSSPHTLTSTSNDSLTTASESTSSQPIRSTPEQNTGTSEQNKVPVTNPPKNGKSTSHPTQSGVIKDQTQDPDSSQSTTPTSEVPEIMDTTTASSGTAGFEFGTTPFMLPSTGNTNMHRTTRTPDIRSTTPLDINEPSNLATAKSSNTTIIAVVVVVVILALGAAGGAVWFFKTKYRKGGSSLNDIPMS